MRHRSKRTAATYRRKRIPLVQALFADQPACAACLAEPAVDPHEILPRGRGGSITDPGNVIPLCRPCHTWVTTNPAEAEARGLSAKSGAARHGFTPDDVGFYCAMCGLPGMNWRHRVTA